MLAPGGWRDIERGDWVYIRWPQKPLPDTVPGWPGRVEEIDTLGRVRRPYRISIVSSYGLGATVLDEVTLMMPDLPEPVLARPE